MLRHLSLFSGIGGLDLAATWAGFTTVAFCERDAFCQTVLRRHWPGVPIYADIADLTDAVVAGLGPIDLLSGGFPCQPFSNAGKRLGQADDRYLWPEMRRVIAAARPGWVCAENVDDLVRLALDDVLADLEALGYTSGAVVLPACAVGAPHIRERCFVVAHSGSQRAEPRRGTGNVAGASRATESQAQERQWGGDASVDCRAVVADTDRQPLEWASVTWPERAPWGAEPPVGRMVDGVPVRVAQPYLRALGNAVVPSQVYPILRLIADHLREEAGGDAA